MRTAYVHDHWNHSQADEEKQQVCLVVVAASILGLYWNYSRGSGIDRMTTHPKKKHLQVNTIELIYWYLVN